MSNVTTIVVLSLGVSLGLVVVGGLGRAGLRAKVPGTVGWDFSKSWASNFTLAGAILGTALSAKILPDKPVVVSGPGGYTSLTLLFAALVVVAPFVYNSTLGTDGAGKPEGRVWSLLGACWLTLWGSLGQLGTVALVFYEAHHVGALAFGAVIPLWIVLGLATVLTFFYALKTISSLVRASAAPAPAAGPGFAPVAPAPAPAAPAGWSLL